jgi:hypothetical protein
LSFLSKKPYFEAKKLNITYGLSEVASLENFGEENSHMAEFSLLPKFSEVRAIWGKSGKFLEF